MQGKPSWEMAMLHIPVGQRGDVVFFHLHPPGQQEEEEGGTAGGCSQVLRCSEMLKHFFDTEQGPLGVSLSSVSVLHTG